MNIERKEQATKPTPRYEPTVWVCLECGEHHPTFHGCPDRCSACGRENFWALRHR